MAAAGAPYTLDGWTSPGASADGCGTSWTTSPNTLKKLWTVYTRSTGLITEVLDGDDFRYVLTRDESRDQSFYHPGIAAGFLSRLYMATGEREWLDLACEYMRFCEYVGDYHFSLLRAGKVGWAASMLYTITGDRSTGTWRSE